MREGDQLLLVITKVKASVPKLIREECLLLTFTCVYCALGTDLSALCAVDLLVFTTILWCGYWCYQLHFAERLRNLPKITQLIRRTISKPRKLVHRG